MELFFIDTKIGVLTGLIKENKLYSLSGYTTILANPKGMTLKGLDIKHTYLFDSKKKDFFKKNTPSPLVKKIKKQLHLFFKGELQNFNIPLYMRGTSFQQKTWHALQKIPYGQTKTYSEIAKQIKKPKSYRAVGSCCAKNPFLIVIPCHRVLSKQGLGGFALSLKVKNQLLNLEQ